MPIEILIIRLSALGDVVHTLPVAAAIKRLIPDVRITWVVEKLASPLLFGNPAVDRVIVFPGKAVLPRLMATPQMVNSWKQVFEFWQQLRATKYDIAIDAQGLFKSAWLALLSGANIRIGFANTREFADKFLTCKVDVGDYFAPDQHIADLNLKLALSLLNLLHIEVQQPLVAEFPLPAIPDETRGRVETRLNTMQRSFNNPLVIIMPGTTWTTKIWPLEKWQQLGQMLIEHRKCQLVICGGQADFIFNKQLEEHLRKRTGQAVINLTGQTNLLELMAMFEKAQMVIGADSGPIHLAAAIGTPKTIGIYGSTPRQRNSPYGITGQAIGLNLECQPCFQKRCPIKTLACLNELSADSVYEQSIRFLEERSIPKQSDQSF